MCILAWHEQAEHNPNAEEKRHNGDAAIVDTTPQSWRWWCGARLGGAGRGREGGYLEEGGEEELEALGPEVVADGAELTQQVHLG